MLNDIRVGFVGAKSSIKRGNKKTLAFIVFVLALIFVNLVFLDEELDAENYLVDPDEYGHLLGFEYNDWDPEDEIGTHKTQITAILYGIFNRDIDDTLNNWVDNKIRTESFRYV